MRPVRSIDMIWVQACEMLERADRLKRQFFRLGEGGQIPVWEPPVDIFESDAELLIRVAIPNINREDFEIRLEGPVLWLSGRRCLPKEATQSVIRRLEIPYGRMERRVTLPPGHFRLTTCTYHNGCLEIRVQRMMANE